MSIEGRISDGWWEDPERFREMYTEYFPRLFAYVSYRVGRRQDAEDLVAETFLTLIREQDRFEWRGESSFAAWLFRIAYNLIQDFYRRSRYQEPLSLEELPALRSEGESPEDTMLRKAEWERQRQLIATLSPRRQEVLTLRFFGGLQNWEIARVLALDERTIASHLCRGLEDLSERWSREAVTSPQTEEHER